MAILLTQLVVTGGVVALSVHGARGARALAGLALEVVDHGGTPVLRVAGDEPGAPQAAPPVPTERAPHHDVATRGARHEAIGREGVVGAPADATVPASEAAHPTKPTPPRDEVKPPAASARAQQAPSGPHPARQAPDAPRIQVPVSSLQVTAKIRGTRWVFDIDAPLPGGHVQNIATAEVLLDVHGVPEGGPSLYLDKRVTLDRIERRISIIADDGSAVSLTDWALARVRSEFAKQFGHEPTNLPGSLTADNRRMFQLRYLDELARGTDREAAKLAAVRATAFGAARARLGYDRFEVTFGATLEEIPHGTPPVPRHVPREIHVEAFRR